MQLGFWNSIQIIHIRNVRLKTNIIITKRRQTSMNYSEKELVNMFKTGTVTSYNKDAGRGIITDETGASCIIQI